ncbi:type II secretion system protein GspK [Aestuariivirga sp.]|uniref:type II secretion system protein GspK n=1 Tax=Aestuariivirga sp. TaxID=2650926 RepID=UPI0025BD6E52|nr:type II secretion system protein GspK [Aestuariivirga sp.]MCA3554453.1 general secretion pathway protein GspK [Aestuariivirga sp.]
MSRARHAAAERGIILVAVLLAVAIMSVMVVAAAALTRAGIGNEQLEQRRLASHLALRSGIEAAKALILAAPDDRRLLFTGDNEAVDLGNGVSATVSLRDAGGLADLNRSDPQLIEAVARSGGLGKAADGLAEKITELRKQAAPGSDVGQPPAKVGRPPPANRNLNAAVPGSEGAKPPVAPIVFLSLDQMPALLGIESADAAALAPVLTVYNPTGQINPLAAPDEVLQSIPGLTNRDISDIAMARRKGAGKDDSRLQQLIQRLPGLLSLRRPRVFMIEVRLAGGPGILPGSAARAVVRVTPEALMPFGTLALEEE